MGFALYSTIWRPATSVVWNMLFVPALFILCVALVCTLMVSDNGPGGFLLVLAAWGVTELAG
jgi:FtsH-binding integral membrane protein